MTGVIPWVLFLGLAGLTAVTAGGMLVTMSMYRAGLALMASFVALAGLFLLLNADLLAAIQIMMNVGGMLIMILFMVMLMIDPGGEMMWDMKRKMALPGPGAFSMSMPRAVPAAAQADAGPAAPAHAGPEPRAGAAPVYTCPMHSDVREGQPGACPICGMDLVPVAAPPPASEPRAGAAPVYTCPMHPEVRESQFGACPLCGMDLVPVAAPVAPASEPRTAASSAYTCPMHSEVRKSQLGACPICGMDLVPVAELAPAPEPLAAASSAYTCPMHSDVRESQLGACPICGMDLVLVAAPPPGPAPPAAAAPVYTCPMHPEARAGQPGHCPICGMDLVPVAVPAPELLAAAPIVYTCPMHPEVRAGGPGQCPLCGMDLVPAAPTPAPEPRAAAAPVYTCPMHPEVRAGGRGQCPICGMDLVPALSAAAADGGVPRGMALESRGDAPAPVAVSPTTAGQHAPLADTSVRGEDMGSTASHTTPMSPGQHYQMMAGMAMSTVQLPWALAIGAACAVALGLLILLTPWPTSPDAPMADATRAVGQLLLSRYMIGFEGAAFLILAGIVGAVVFATRERPAGSVVALVGAPRAGDTSVAAAPDLAAPVYTCPMHPEIRAAHPGECPLCGMDLVPADAGAPALQERAGPPRPGGAS